MQLQSAQGQTRVFSMVESANHSVPLVGASPSVSISFVGHAFGAAQNSPATSIGDGWYSIFLTPTDLENVGDLAFYITASLGDPVNFTDQVVAQIFPNMILTNGRMMVYNNYQQNSPISGFSFLMTNSSTGAPAPGLAVNAFRSIAGAGFSVCTNPVVELGNGLYYINLSATDTNGSSVMLRFTATGANDLDLDFVTQP